MKHMGMMKIAAGKTTMIAMRLLTLNTDAWILRRLI
jgi:hypothetical protein